MSSCCFDLIPQIAGPVPVMVEGGPLTVSYTFCLVPCINSAAAEAVSLKCPFSDSWSSARAYLLCDTKLFEDLLSYFFFSCQSLPALQHSSFQTVATAEGAAEKRGSQTFGSPCSAGKEAATKCFLVVAFPMLGNGTDFSTDNSYPKEFGLPVS